MADATIRFKTEVDLAGIKSIEKEVSRMNLGKTLADSFTKDFAKITTKLKELSKVSIGADSKPEELKAYVEGHQEVYNLQKKIAEEVKNEIQLKLKAAGSSLTSYKNTEKMLARDKDSLLTKQQLLKTDILANQAIAKNVTDMEKKVALAKEELRLAQVEVDKYSKPTTKASDDTKARVAARLKEATKAYEELNTQQKEYMTRNDQITAQEGVIKTIKEDINKKEDTLARLKKETGADPKVIAELEKQSKILKENLTDAEKKVNLIKSEGKAQQEVSGIMEKLGERMKKFAEYTIAAFAFRHIRQFAVEGLKFVADLDKSLTEIATVTGKTRDEMWKMAKDFNQMGRELGKTTNEITQGAVLFTRQGLSMNQVMTMVRASTISAAIANTSASEASDRLTAALRGYNMEAGQAMAIADKLAALAAKSASSFDELSYAMTKTASSAAVAGIDVDHLYAYLAKVIETTREAPENIGTAFKTIIARPMAA